MKRICLFISCIVLIAQWITPRFSLDDTVTAQAASTATETVSATETPTASPVETVEATPSPAATETPAPTATPEPVIKSCVFIGDSLTERGVITDSLMKLAASESATVKLIGTRGSGLNKHEGRGGWKTYYYTTRKSLASVKNSFFNPKTKKFDFSYYIKANKLQKPQYVFIELGINDTFTYTSDRALNIEIPKILARYEAMIKSIQAYNKNTKIGIVVTIPPTSRIDTFRKDYGSRQTLARYARNNARWVAALKSKFKGREKSNIFLVPADKGIDRRQIVGVHPNGTGYRQMAAVIWDWLKQH